jgi:hypothetical protein
LFQTRKLDKNISDMIYYIGKHLFTKIMDYAKYTINNILKDLKTEEVVKAIIADGYADILKPFYKQYDNN